MRQHGAVGSLCSDDRSHPFLDFWAGATIIDKDIGCKAFTYAFHLGDKVCSSTAASGIRSLPVVDMSALEVVLLVASLRETWLASPAHLLLCERSNLSCCITPAPVTV